MYILIDCTLNQNLKHICDKWGIKTHCLSVLAFLLNRILHCICFKLLFTESKYLVFHWSYTRLSRTIKKWKNWI